MKIKLNNLYYTTADKSKIDRLIGLGAVVVEQTDEEIKKAADEDKDKRAELEDMTNTQLRELLELEGIEYGKNDNKETLIEKYMKDRQK